MTNIDFVKQTYDKMLKRHYPECYQCPEAMIQMRFDKFSEVDMQYFRKMYETTKDIPTRNQILGAFVLQCLQYELKDFFFTAFKKERYLDMRLTAIRGFASYADETEVIPLMNKFIELLIKIPSQTPYDYEEYECLRSKFGLPYLVEHYGYDCFKKALVQMEKQYDEMPDACKGFFTLDENGLNISLMTTEEIKHKLDLLSGRV